jgi:ProP effector
MPKTSNSRRKNASEGIKPIAKQSTNKAKREIVLGTRKILVERFPQTFRGFGQPKLPLKIGIKADLFASPVVADLDKYAIGCALRDYCTGPTYHGAMLTGVSRVDLEGNAVDIVNDTAERHHAANFARITHKRKQRAEAVAAAREAKASDGPTETDLRQPANSRGEIVLDNPNYQGPSSLMFVDPRADVEALRQQAQAGNP